MSSGGRDTEDKLHLLIKTQTLGQGSWALLSYRQRARVPAHTPARRAATPTCDLGCVFVGRVRV